MATSGTHAFTLDLSEIIEEAYECSGVEFRSGYDYRSARRSLDILLLEWQNRGLNLWTLKEGSETLVAGTASYTLDAEKLDIIEGLIRLNDGVIGSQTDYTMKRISISSYAQLTNKLTQGRPTQYWIDRQPEALVVYMWPVPDAQQTYKFNYYYMEKIEDTGKPANLNVDVPSRYLPALTAGLAYHLARKNPTAFKAIETLKAIYEEQWELASDASREKASVRFVPRIYRV